MGELYIYSDPIKSGKTTKLMQWAASQKNIDGIFQPVIEGKRFLYHISSRSLKPLEIEKSNDTTTIGQYIFSNQAFLWAQEKLIKAINNEIDWLVIDEIGPLELEGKGLEPAISKILAEVKHSNQNVIIVVRKNLLDKITAHYKLENKYNSFNI